VDLVVKVLLAPAVVAAEQVDIPELLAPVVVMEVHQDYHPQPLREQLVAVAGVVRHKMGEVLVFLDKDLMVLPVVEQVVVDLEKHMVVEPEQYMHQLMEL
jgi:hypothetical protein